MAASIGEQLRLAREERGIGLDLLKETLEEALELRLDVTRRVRDLHNEARRAAGLA